MRKVWRKAQPAAFAHPASERFHLDKDADTAPDTNLDDDLDTAPDTAPDMDTDLNEDPATALESDTNPDMDLKTDPDPDLDPDLDEDPGTCPDMDPETDTDLDTDPGIRPHTKLATGMTAPIAWSPEPDQDPDREPAWQTSGDKQACSDDSASRAADKRPADTGATDTWADTTADNSTEEHEMHDTMDWNSTMTTCTTQGTTCGSGATPETTPETTPRTMPDPAPCHCTAHGRGHCCGDCAGGAACHCHTADAASTAAGTAGTAGWNGNGNDEDDDDRGGTGGAPAAMAAPCPEACPGTSPDAGTGTADAEVAQPKKRGRPRKRVSFAGLKAAARSALAGQSSVRDESGFTLVEVLGALVVGSLVFAFAAFGISGGLESARVSGFNESLALLRVNIHETYASSRGFGSSSDAGTDITEDLVNAGAIPQNWLAADESVVHNFGGSVSVTGTVHNFTITADAIPEAVCRKIVSSQLEGWDSISVGGSDVTELPVTTCEPDEGGVGVNTLSFLAH